MVWEGGRKKARRWGKRVGNCGQGTKGKQQTSHRVNGSQRGLVKMCSHHALLL